MRPLERLAYLASLTDEQRRELRYANARAKIAAANARADAAQLARRGSLAPAEATPRPLPWWIVFFADHGRMPTLREEREARKQRRAAR